MIETVNPTSGQIIRKYNFHSEVEVERRVKLVDLAAHTWRSFSLSERASYLLVLAENLEIERDRLAFQMVLEIGKPISQAHAEIKKSINTLRYYAENSESFLKEQLVSAHYKVTKIKPLPLGNILAIMPWNFPLWQVIRAVAPALMTGNAFFLKHAPECQGFSEILESIFLRSFPVPVLHNFCLSNEQTAKLISHNKTSALTFTGSTEVGKKVASLAGSHLKKVVLELGSRDPAIVTESADISLAAKIIARARLQNNGQSCIATKRVFVQRQVAKNFLNEIEMQFQQIQIGDPSSYETDLGPLAAQRFLDSAKQMMLMQDTSQSKLLFQGDIPEEFTSGFFLAPHLFLLDEPRGALWENEVFAPILPVYIYENLEDVYKIVGAESGGLGASVFGDFDVNLQSQIANSLAYPNISFNQLLATDPRVPFGGIKGSGFGTELGWQSLYEFAYWQVLGS